jgi:hypothetical protein
MEENSLLKSKMDYNYSINILFLLEPGVDENSHIPLSFRRASLSSLFFKAIDTPVSPVPRERSDKNQMHMHVNTQPKNASKSQGEICFLTI